MVAIAVVYDLQRDGIISDSCQVDISRARGRKQQNEILHEQLVTHCTIQALIDACNIFIAAAGYPKMNALGAAMKKHLEAGVCVCVCVFCVHVCVCDN